MLTLWEADIDMLTMNRLLVRVLQEFHYLPLPANGAIITIAPNLEHVSDMIH